MEEKELGGGKRLEGRRTKGGGANAPGIGKGPGRASATLRTITMGGGEEKKSPTPRKPQTGEKRRNGRK